MEKNRSILYPERVCRDCPSLENGGVCGFDKTMRDNSAVCHIELKFLYYLKPFDEPETAQVFELKEA